jgi:methyltransferase (TIGR00027 family)
VRSGQPSHTAQRVAAYRLASPRVVAPFGNPDADDQLARDVADAVAVDHDSAMARYLAARTAFIDGVVVAALGRGTPQVVVAGAGYDARSLRYAKAGVRWFELDHPSTQADKVERLGRLGLNTTAVSFVPVDFRDGDVSAALATAGHDSGAPTLFVCEGVAVYLDRAVLEDLLRHLRRRAATGSELAVTLSVAGAGAETAERRRRFQAAVATMGEPARTVLTAADAASLFTATGWSAASAASAATAADRTSRAGRAGLVTAVPV